MGKMRCFLLTVLAAGSCSVSSFAQDVKLSDFYNLMPWMKIVHEYGPVTFDIITHLPASTDFKTNAAILEVTGLQAAIENRTNQLTDSLVRIQSSTAAMMSATYAIQKSYEQSLTATSEFEEGSKFYEYVMEMVNNVINEGNELDRIVRRSEIPNKDICIREIDELKKASRRLVNEYVSIVTNGNADGDGFTTAMADDGYNSMSRKKRLDTCRDIAGQLRRMRGSIQYLTEALLACEQSNYGGNTGKKMNFDAIGTAGHKSVENEGGFVATAARWFNHNK